LAHGIDRPGDLIRSSLFVSAPGSLILYILNRKEEAFIVIYHVHLMVKTALVISVSVFVAVFHAASYSCEANCLHTLVKLDQAILRGIESNFELKAEKLVIPQSRENIVIEAARFDPTVRLGVSAEDQKNPTSVVFYKNEYSLSEQYVATAAVDKIYETGLQARLNFETSRSENNFLTDTLDPQYRTVLVLNLTQPILRDFGVDINTTHVQVSENLLRQSFLKYSDAARLLAQAIELAYHDLASAEAVLKYRTESRELAKKLMIANRQRLEKKLVSVTEVTEAQTAVSDRDEKLILARQQMEILSNRLKDLLEIGPDDPLFHKLIRTEGLLGAHKAYPAIDQALATAMKEREDLKQLRIGIDSQELMIAFFKNQKLPRVDLVASAGVSGLSGGDRPVNLFGTSRSSAFEGNYADSYSSMTEDDGYQWSAGLRFEYPIGNKAARSRLVREKYEKQKLKYLLKRTKGKIRTEVKNAFVSVTRSRQRVKETETFVELAQTTLAQETRRLKEGLSDTFHILDYQEKVIDAKIRYVFALADFHKSVAALYGAMGTNLERQNIRLETDDKSIETR
jgi:outer membrane protein TolC